METLLLTKANNFFSFGPVADVLGWIMDLLFRFTNLFGIMNIGLCIILFTAVIKLLLLPLTIKQQKSSKLMAVMQPEMKMIQEKYKGKTDQQSMMMQNQEMKALYEKYGTSMTGGCLQLIIQMPILFALYQVILNIPAYVPSVRAVFDTVVNAIGGMNAAEVLTQFATDNNISMATIQAITDNNKIVDLLYKLTPSQWTSLEALFPQVQETIHECALQIEQMNSFLGLNLTEAPWQGFMPNWAWLIPIASGLAQWYSTKLMTANQSTPTDENTPGASMMKSVNIYMPLMSVFFCFTFASGVGLYWVSSSVFMIIQQMIINAYLKKIDVDEMVKKNIEKANKKRAKQGLPPVKQNQNASLDWKHIKEENEKREAARMEKIAKSQAQAKESTEYYNQNAKPGSLAAKAGMVQKYNEKHEKRK